MRIDSLQQFIKLRRELMQERDSVSRRLAQINEALGELPASSESAVQGVTEQSSAPARSPARGGGRQAAAGAGGGTSLREHVLAVLREGGKTKEEVLAAVQRRGYKFQTNNPLNSLGVILYGKNPKFNRVDGRFSLPGGAAASSRGGAGGGGGGRRQMSPAARARIADAQRKRWAAARRQGGGAGSKPAAKPAGGGSGRRQISPAARRAIAEAARRRWAAAKAAGKNRL
jgi:hypothetical protein